MIDFHLLFSSPLVVVLFESEDNSPPFPPALPPLVLPQNTLKCRGPLREDATNLLEETTPLELLLASAELFLIHCRVNEDDTDNDEDEECVLSFFHDDDDDDDSPENNATGGFLETPPSCGRDRRAVGDLRVPNDPIIGDRYAHVEEDPIVVVDASLWYRAAPLFFFVVRIAEFLFCFFLFCQIVNFWKIPLCLSLSLVPQTSKFLVPFSFIFCVCFLPRPPRRARFSFPQAGHKFAKFFANKIIW